MTNVRDAIIRSITEASIRCKSAWTVIDQNKWDSKKNTIRNGAKSHCVRKCDVLLFEREEQSSRFFDAQIGTCPKPALLSCSSRRFQERRAL